MEEDAPAKPSVAELAGKFKGHTPPIPTGNEGSKPVRRRPPRTLQIPTRIPGQGEEEEEKPSLTSPLPAKTKRNSALIEKLQANLALSPTALHPSPKSPGLRLLPQSFTPPSPSSIKPIITATPTSPGGMAGPPRPGGEEEAPATFQTPASPTEGSLLPSINKSRARVSLRRRPPSRRHRKSSSGEEVGGATGEDTPLSTPDGPEAGGKEVFEGEEEKEKEAGVISSSTDDTNVKDPAGTDLGDQTSKKPQAEEARGGREDREGGEGLGEEASPKDRQVDGNRVEERCEEEGEKNPEEKKEDKTTVN